MSDSKLRTLAAAYGFIGVALGAFGAHALADRLAVYGKDQWQTATLYCFFHVAATLAILNKHRTSAILFLAGITVFSGSLYLLALTQVRILGAITTIGGVLFLSGWLILAIKEARSHANPPNQPN